MVAEQTEYLHALLEDAPTVHRFDAPDRMNKRMAARIKQMEALDAVGGLENFRAQYGPMVELETAQYVRWYEEHLLYERARVAREFELDTQLNGVYEDLARNDEAEVLQHPRFVHSRVFRKMYLMHLLEKKLAANTKKQEEDKFVTAEEVTKRRMLLADLMVDWEQNADQWREVGSCTR